MRNDIDIQFCKTLNETNKERIYEHQVELIIKVQEFESLCLKQLNVDSASDFQVTIEQTESNLNGPVVTKAELDRVKELLLNELLKVEKVLFKDKSMFFVEVGNIAAENSELFLWLYKTMKNNNFLGLLVMIEDCFIRRDVFKKK